MMKGVYQGVPVLLLSVHGNDVP